MMEFNRNKKYENVTEWLSAITAGNNKLTETKDFWTVNITYGEIIADKDMFAWLK